MSVIQVTEKNKKEYGGKCVVLSSHIHDKNVVNPGDIVFKYGMDYFEALKCKLVRDYSPETDEPKKELTDEESKAVIENMEVDPSPKKKAKKK